MRQPLRSFRAMLRYALPAVALLTAVGAAQAQTYWFETYQRAVSLIDANQPDEAATLLEQVIQDHPLPQAAMRIPGYQFLDYLPYYQRARIELLKGQYERAAHSLDVSEAFGAVRSSKRSTADLARLRQQVDAAQASNRPAPTVASDSDTIAGR